MRRVKCVKVHYIELVVELLSKLPGQVVVAGRAGSKKSHTQPLGSFTVILQQAGKPLEMTSRGVCVFFFFFFTTESIMFTAAGSHYDRQQVI